MMQITSDDAVKVGPFEFQLEGRQPIPDPTQVLVYWERPCEEGEQALTFEANGAHMFSIFDGKRRIGLYGHYQPNGQNFFAVHCQHQAIDVPNPFANASQIEQQAST